MIPVDTKPFAMPSFCFPSFDQQFLSGAVVGIGASVAIYSSYSLWNSRKCSSFFSQGVDKTGTACYESQKMLNDYLLFHYGTKQDNMFWDFGPHNGLEFPKRCAELCLKHYKNQLAQSESAKLKVSEQPT